MYGTSNVTSVQDIMRQSDPLVGQNQYQRAAELLTCMMQLDDHPIVPARATKHPINSNVDVSDDRETSSSSSSESIWDFDSLVSFLRRPCTADTQAVSDLICNSLDDDRLVRCIEMLAAQNGELLESHSIRNGRDQIRGNNSIRDISGIPWRYMDSVMHGGPQRSRRALVLGDGDFSFSAGLLRAFSIVNDTGLQDPSDSDDKNGDGDNCIATKQIKLTATSLELQSSLTQKYSEFASNTQIIESLGGDIAYEVDATNIHNHVDLRTYSDIDTVIFNFPFADTNAPTASKSGGVLRPDAHIDGGGNLSASNGAEKDDCVAKEIEVGEMVNLQKNRKQKAEKSFATHEMARGRHMKLVRGLFSSVRHMHDAREIDGCGDPGRSGLASDTTKASDCLHKPSNSIRVCITLLISQAVAWEVEYVALTEGFELSEIIPFEASTFSFWGYSRKRTYNDDSFKSDERIHSSRQRQKPVHGASHGDPDPWSPFGSSISVHRGAYTDEGPLDRLRLAVTQSHEWPANPLSPVDAYVFVFDRRVDG
jgi:hypothetical protein